MLILCIFFIHQNTITTTGLLLPQDRQDHEKTPEKGFLKRTFDKVSGGFSRQLRKMRQPSLDRALLLSVKNSYESRASRLIEAGANVRANDFEAFREAASRGNAEMLDILLNAGVTANEDGGRAFLCAVEGGHRECAKLLLMRGADVNVGEGQAVILAASLNNIRMLDLLITWKGDVNAQGGLPLQKAAEAGHQHIVNLLLRSGSQVTGEDDPAIAIAEQKGWKRCAEIIRLHLAEKKLAPKPPEGPKL